VLRHRIEHDFDIDQLAARLGVDAEVVGVLEGGEDDPDPQTLRLLSERLGFGSPSTSTPAPPPASRSSTRSPDT